MKVLTAGHICLDITPEFISGNLDSLIPGRLYDMQGISIHLGGAVSNTGLAMKFFGADVRLTGKIGTDLLGDIVLKQLNEKDAASSMIIDKNSQTSYTVVVAPPGVDRIFLHQSGANDTFSLKDFSEQAFDDVDLFHFGYPPIMEQMYINDGEQLVDLFRMVKDMGIVTSLDMASVSEERAAGMANWDLILRRVLPYVDFFVPSAEELGFMLNREQYHGWQQKASGCDVISVLDIELDIKPMADKAQEYGAGTVLIKSGAKGMYCKTASQPSMDKIAKRLNVDLSDWGGRQHFEYSYKPEHILSSTGAGDTSIAAFLCSILRGFGFERTLQFTTATGASCLEAYDSLSGLLSFTELEQKIEAGWEKNTF
ncbi:MAG: carbohydrate kinase family protein [Clostridiaceae bacterium]|nr:carbohydrate kinase family protein [Clostridiaceae bacterium]